MLTKFPELFIDVIAQIQEAVTEFLGVFFEENGTWKPTLTPFSPKFLKAQTYFIEQA